MGSAIQYFICFALIVNGDTNRVLTSHRKKTAYELIENDVSEQQYFKTLAKEIKREIETHIETEIKSLKCTLDKSVSHLKTFENEILKSQLELELQMSLLQSNVDHCRCSIKCDATWMRYREHCYKYFADWKTYDEAKQACAHENAFLLDVNDQQEMNFVMLLVDKIKKDHDFEMDFWLGMTRKGKGGSWTMDRTGVKATYLNWRPSEPMIAHGNCVIAGFVKPYEEWIAFDCTSSANFVCKK